MSQSLQAPASRQKQFMDLYRQGKHKLAMTDAEKLVLDYPEDAFAWKALGNCQLQIAPDEAKETLERAYSLDPDDPLTLTALARACFMAGEKQRAQALQARSIELDSGNAQAHFNMGHMLYQMGSYPKAEKFLSKAEELGHSPAEVLAMRSVILSLHFKFKEGLEALNRLYALKPEDPTVHNTLGNYHKDMADFRKAEWHYREALRLRPDYSGAYSNEILTKHYDPEASAESILQKSKKWSTRFKPPQTFDHGEKDKSPNRRLRVGLLSGNLRAHPVGWMISSALEQLSDDIELHAYSDTDAGDNDPIAERIKKACEWKPVYHLNHRQLAERIFEDDIDILIELAGHGGLNRLPTVDTKPAPIIVKWVGMQISSMGIDAFDYFLSDNYETPAGVDHFYTEKLIRLPDDYICYQPPSYKPAITALPSLSNGYITFGCFNNPAKVNDTLLAEWALLLQQLPGSRLFLKGGQYSSDEVCERVLTTLEKHGVERSRVLLEGPSQHKELLESYNRVDIALDTWPYSGGLTTCEALLMGVPVVTHTGPTFAGRHSATHLCNAGMPELVTDNWDDYRKRVLDLAADLPSLAVIRAALRTYLEQSPICDAPKFGRHLHKTLRGIWQRYCEDKAPAALTFNKGGQAWFEDDSKPVKLHTELQRGFDWDLESPVVILDNGVNIAMRSDAKELLSTGNIALLAFDPTNLLRNANELSQYGEIQHFPQTTLGDGQPTSLMGLECENDITSLKPLTSGIADSLQTLEIPSVALDSIQGLESLDVLALDDRHDNLAILEHGAKALEKALLLQIRVRFNPTHEGQADLGSLTRWASEHGFRFYRLHNAEYRSHLPDETPVELKQASDLVSADALFISSESRIATLSSKLRIKMAFLLHAAYGAKDMAYALLGSSEGEKAKKYLVEENLLANSNTATTTLPPNSVKGLKAILEESERFHYQSQEQLERTISKYENLLTQDPKDNASFFLLTQALKAKPAIDHSLDDKLKRVGWSNKRSIFQYWFSFHEEVSKIESPKISVIIVSTAPNNKVLECLKLLKTEGKEFAEIIFVSNGPSKDNFPHLNSYVNHYIQLKGNAGASHGRNAGALFANAPVVLFVEDDGVPEDGFIQSHIDIHKDKNIWSVRGVYIPFSNGASPPHYFPSETPCIMPVNLEGNSSYKANPFYTVGGWEDRIMYGHEGLELAYRLFKFDNDQSKQIYHPKPRLQHNYYHGSAHLKNKMQRLATSSFLINHIAPGWDKIKWPTIKEKAETKLKTKLEKQDTINMFWWDRVSNFGDKIGPYLAKKITGKEPVNLDRSSISPPLVSVGSIIHLINKPGFDIWGSGLIHPINTATYKNLVDNKPRKIHALRGLLTYKEVTQKLGWEAPQIFGDPALLMPKFFTPSKDASEGSGKIAIVPHYSHYKYFTSCGSKEAQLVNVQDDLQKIISEIANSKACISTSLHGVIIAHAYKVPWTWVKIEDKTLYGDTFKFEDFFSLLDSDNISKEEVLSRDIPNLDIIKLAEKSKLPRDYYDLEALRSSFPLTQPS